MVLFMVIPFFFLFSSARIWTLKQNSFCSDFLDSNFHLSIFFPFNKKYYITGIPASEAAKFQWTYAIQYI